MQIEQTSTLQELIDGVRDKTLVLDDLMQTFPFFMCEEHKRDGKTGYIRADEILLMIDFENKMKEVNEKFWRTENFL
jgi:hypothetical protein